MHLTGMSVYLDTIKNTHVEVSFGSNTADSDVMRENIGLDFSYDAPFNGQPLRPFKV